MSIFKKFEMFYFHRSGRKELECGVYRVYLFFCTMHISFNRFTDTTNIPHPPQVGNKQNHSDNFGLMRRPASALASTSSKHPTLTRASLIPSTDS
jgi:hypothetical protein